PDRFNNPHNSFKFLGHSTDNLMENMTIHQKMDHGYAVQRHAVGNVIYNSSMAPGCDLDPHAQVPMANLYDNISGGRHSGAGGNAGTTPHHGPYFVLWNFTATGETNRDDHHLLKVMQWYDDMSYPLQTIRPVFAGYDHAAADVKVQYVDDSKRDYYVSDTVVVEAINGSVLPQSLYMAQLQERIGRDREAGLIVRIEGPTNVMAQKSYQFTAKAVGASASQFSWLIDSTTQKNGSTLEHTFETPGRHELMVTATTPGGAHMRRSHVVYVSQSGGILIARAEADEIGLHGRRVVNTGGRMWHFVEGESNRNTFAYINGSTFGFGSVNTNNTGSHGGYCYTELPPEGIDLSTLKYRVHIKALESGMKKKHYFRFLARDKSGVWAMSTKQLDTVFTTGEFSQIEWTPPLEIFALSSEASFNPAATTALGMVMYFPENWWYGSKEVLAAFETFEIGQEFAAVPTNPTKATNIIRPSIRHAHGTLFITIPNSSKHKAHITSLQGRMIKLLENSGAQTYRFDALPRGLYFVRIIADGTQWTRKALIR
ncbi:MAG: DUF4955 domain-containing protein, partial [Chitinivibrionales bacterium]|nr:DUF4955 domain-containing protein [Chitinivibrionales bacterium]